METCVPFLLVFLGEKKSQPAPKQHQTQSQYIFECKGLEARDLHKNSNL